MKAAAENEEDERTGEGERRSEGVLWQVLTSGKEKRSVCIYGRALVRERYFFCPSLPVLPYLFFPVSFRYPGWCFELGDGDVLKGKSSVQLIFSLYT